MLNLIRNINNSIVILLCLGILIFGLICDLCSLYSILNNLHFVIFIKDELIYTILQIQVTLSTLTIAMIALVTNRVEKEIYGVALADYFMHKKYGILCQVNVIILIIFLNIFSIYLYISGFYTLIFSVLWCIIILLVRMLGCVSMVMLPSWALEQEISKYVVNNFKEDEKLMSNLINPLYSKDENNMFYDISLNANLMLDLWGRILGKKADE